VASSLRHPPQVEREQPLQNLLVAEVGRPAVGGGDGSVEAAVGQGEPGGTLVVQVRERALLEFAGGVFVAGDQRGWRTVPMEL
jgi:hypothetical protein